MHGYKKNLQQRQIIMIQMKVVVAVPILFMMDVKLTK